MFNIKNNSAFFILLAFVMIFFARTHLTYNSFPPCYDFFDSFVYIYLYQFNDCLKPYIQTVTTITTYIPTRKICFYLKIYIL